MNELNKTDNIVEWAFWAVREKEEIERMMENYNYHFKLTEVISGTFECWQPWEIVDCLPQSRIQFATISISICVHASNELKCELKSKVVSIMGVERKERWKSWKFAVRSDTFACEFSEFFILLHRLAALIPLQTQIFIFWYFKSVRVRGRNLETTMEQKLVDGLAGATKEDEISDNEALQKVWDVSQEHVRSIWRDSPCIVMREAGGGARAICYCRDNNEDVNAQFYALEGLLLAKIISKGFQNLWLKFHLAADFDTHFVQCSARVFMTKILVGKRVR